MSCKFISFLFLVIAVPACFLSKEYKQTSFTYTRNGQPVTLPLLVPKGYTKDEQLDTAGVTMHVFHYGNGAILYAAYVADSTVELQPINHSLNMPLRGPQGGWVYKGMDEHELFHRVIQQGPLRFGYRNVPGDVEVKFDSATNFMALQGR